MRTILITMLLASSLAVSAQEYEVVRSAFANADINAIRSLLAPSVDYAHGDEILTLGRGDAESKIRSFFIDHEPRAFNIVHEGESSNGIHYIIGNLTTDGAVFRMTIYMDDSSGNLKIQSIEIEDQ